MLDQDAPTPAVSPAHLAAGDQITARHPRLLRIRARHGGKVDDASRRRVQRRHADGVRLDLGDLLPLEHLHATDAVRARPPVQLLQP